MIEILETVSEIVVVLGAWTFFVIFFVALLEGVIGVGILVPGSTLMVVFGVVAAHQNAEVLVIILIAAVGATLGDHVSYYLGRHYGRGWLTQKKWPFTAVDLSIGEKYFARHGAHSVFFACFIPVVNKVIPFTAGSLHMDRKQFFIYNILGDLGWATVWVGLGYVLGHSLHLLEQWTSRVEIILGGLFLAYAIYLVYRYVLYRLTQS